MKRSIEDTTVVPAAEDPGTNVERKARINGSEAASVVGENPYEMADELMFKKMLGIQFKGNEATEHGKKYESVALRKLCQEVGCKLLPIRYATSPTFPWLGGTIDALLEFPDGTVAIAEVKCPLKRRIVPGKIPGHYTMQPQLYMHIWNSIDPRISKCLFVQYVPPRETPVKKIQREEVFDVTTVEMDRRYMLERLPTMKEFWDKMFVWQMTKGKYQMRTAGLLITVAYKSKGKRQEDVKKIARAHWLCRLKAAAVRATLEIPYQTPEQLKRDYMDYRVREDPPILVRKQFRVQEELRYTNP
jgi:putative phage-type endonuclease